MYGNTQGKDTQQLMPCYIYYKLYLRQWIVEIQLPESPLRTFLKVLIRLTINILLREFEKLSVSPVLIRWIAAFLTNRQQAVKIGDTTSEWRTVKGGIPQGTKLGVILCCDDKRTNRRFAFKNQVC